MTALTRKLAMLMLKQPILNRNKGKELSPGRTHRPSPLGPPVVKDFDDFLSVRTRINGMIDIYKDRRNGATLCV